MACEGWGVGDKCRVNTTFAIAQRSFSLGDEGEVRTRNSALHELEIYWPKFQTTVKLTHSQIHNLMKIP